MDYLQDATLVFKQSLTKTVKSIRYMPMLILVQVGLSALSLLIFRFIYTTSVTGLLTGIIAALIMAALWSVYLYAVSHAVHGDKLTIGDLKHGPGAFFRDVYIATFVIYLLQLVLGMLSIPFLSIILVLALSALPETIYLARTAGYENIPESLRFLKDNWYIWLPMTLIMYLVLNTFGLSVLLNVPIQLFFDHPLLIITHLVLFSFFAIFRGHMYQSLYLSNIRKRKFMAKF